MRPVSFSLFLPVLSSIGVFAAPLEPFPKGVLSSEVMKSKTKTATHSCSATDDAEFSTFVTKSLKSNKPHHKSKTKHHLTEEYITASPSPTNSDFVETIVEETEVVTYMVTDSASATDAAYPTTLPVIVTFSAALAARDEQNNAADSILGGDVDDDDEDDDDDDVGKSTKSKKHKSSTKSKKHRHHTKSCHKTRTTQESPQETITTVKESPQEIERVLSTSYKTIWKEAPKQTVHQEVPKQSCQPSTISVYPSTQWVTLPPSTQPTAPSEDIIVQESVSYRTIKTIRPTDEWAAVTLAARETAAPAKSSNMEAENSAQSKTRKASKCRSSTKPKQTETEDPASEKSSRPMSGTASKTYHSPKPKQTEEEDTESATPSRFRTQKASKTHQSSKPKQTDEEDADPESSSQSKTHKASMTHQSSKPKQTEKEDVESEGAAQSKTHKAPKTHHSSKTMEATSLEPTGSNGMPISYRTIHPSGTKARAVAKPTTDPNVVDDTVSSMLSATKNGSLGNKTIPYGSSSKTKGSCGNKTKSGASGSKTRAAVSGTKTKVAASGTKTKAHPTTKETDEPDDESK